MHKIKDPTFYETRLSEWPRGELPGEKLRQMGASSLSDVELLALLLRTGSKNRSALEIARVILTRYRNLRELAALSGAEFSRWEGIGPVKAASLAAAFEIARRINSLPLHPRLKITDPEVVFRRYEPLLSHLQKEVFMVLILSSANALIRDVQISEGILNSSLVHPREVFKVAILESAASVILLHNHPSGEAEPSQEDKNITKRLVELGKLMDIPVLDHIIIGQGKYFSFREAGLIESS